jgi:predicted transcriptional regulator
MKHTPRYHLGELEADIMDAVWHQDSVSVRQVLHQLKKRRQIAYTTVMTVMGRLVDKKVLRRQLQPDGAYSYQAVCDKQTFLAKTSKIVLHDLFRQCGDVAVAQFVDLLEQRKDSKSKQWRQQLKSRRLI